MEILYNNKIIVSISVGLFISTLYYNFNKVNNER